MMPVALLVFQLSVMEIKEPTGTCAKPNMRRAELSVVLRTLTWETMLHKENKGDCLKNIRKGPDPLDVRWIPLDLRKTLLSP